MEMTPLVYNEIDLELDFSNKAYVVFEIETSGLKAEENDIIRILAVKVMAGKVIETFDEYVKINGSLSDFAKQTTQITDEMLQMGKPLEDVLKEFLNFSQDTVLVAHNARFELDFLTQKLSDCQLPSLAVPIIDTLMLAEKLYPDRERNGLLPLSRDFKLLSDGETVPKEKDIYLLKELFEIFLTDLQDKLHIHNLNQLNQL